VSTKLLGDPGCQPCVAGPQPAGVLLLPSAGMDAITCLKTRRSVRVFRDAPVDRPVVEDIVDCARLSASANNAQPWTFVAIDDPKMRRRIADMTEWGKFMAQAPVCIAVLCRRTRYYLEDGSAATQNLLNAARAHGLGSCWVAGDKKPYAEAIAALLGAPEDVLLVSLVALGEPAEEPAPPKKCLTDVLRWNRC
jgi:nitroreductase